MTEELTNGENRKRKLAKSGATSLWGRWKARNNKEKIEALIRSTIAAGVIGGSVIGTVGYVRATDAQNTIRDNEDAWLKDLQGAQAAAEEAAAIATQAQSVADKAAADALTSKAAAEFAKAQAESANERASTAQDTANQATATAERAKATAETTKAAAEDAQSKAEEARATAASTQSFAEETQNELNVLIQQFNDGQAVTEQQIDDARARAIAAQASADNAEGLADGAQFTADSAQNKADQAQAAADAAQVVADKAVADALAAQTTADGAQDAADAAQATANDALLAAQNAQADADAAQATADEALAIAIDARTKAETALGKVPLTTTFANQPIPDNVGVYDDPPAGSIVLQPGRYLVYYGGTYPQAFGTRLRVGPTVIASFACQAAGFRTGTAVIEITAPDTVVFLDHDSCGANVATTFERPFITYTKVG